MALLIRYPCVYNIIYTLIGLLGLLFNGICLYYLHKKRLFSIERQSFKNLIYLHTLSNFGLMTFCTLGVPLFAFFFTHSRYVPYLLWIYLQNLIDRSIIICLVLIAFDRFITIIYPNKFASLLTNKSSSIIFKIYAILMIILAIEQGLVIGCLIRAYYSIRINLAMVYYLIISDTIIMGLLIVLSILFGVIFYFLAISYIHCCYGGAGEGGNNNNSDKEQDGKTMPSITINEQLAMEAQQAEVKKSNVKLTYVSTLVALIILILSLPNVAANFFWINVDSVSYSLYYFSGMLHPIIYLLANSKMRKKVNVEFE